MRSSTVDASFSQMRGGPAKYVGDTSRRFWKRVSMRSTKLTTSPTRIATKTAVQFSKMWAKGRYDTTSSSGPDGIAWISDSTAHKMFR
jgi:hypothetical protein